MSATRSSADLNYPTPNGDNRSWFRDLFDVRLMAPAFITIILLVGQLTGGILEGYRQTLLAIGTAIVVEMLWSRLLGGKWPHLASAYITGISVGILVRSPEWWPFALCAAIAISSKYALRIKGRHLWNPSNFGISFMLLAAPFAVATLSIQWGNNLWPMVVIWALGTIIVYRVKRLHITLTYVVAFFVLGYLRALITGHTYLSEIAPITGPMYQLFIFFMITDPKTTVRSSKLAQCIVVFLVAVAEAILRLMQNVHAPYYALFIVGPLATLVEIWWGNRGRRPEVRGQWDERQSKLTSDH
jgi:Na+-transporting NADH:ubiquinone oxidoreductase subunit NqrB